MTTGALKSTVDPNSTRRKALRLLDASAVACPVCMYAVVGRGTAASAAAGGHAAPNWGYQGDGVPANWGRLSPDFKVCELGLDHTLIDLNGGVTAGAGELEIGFKPMPLKGVNNGHTIQMNCEAGSRSMVNGAAYDLLQFHFHHPSEHLA